jgi:hypothetical protein
MDVAVMAMAIGVAGIFAGCIAPILHRIGRHLDRAACIEAKELTHA